MLNQYNRRHSTLRRICAFIDENGPQTMEQLAERLHLTYAAVRNKAALGEEDGYLVRTDIERRGPSRRKLLICRTDLKLPDLDEAEELPRHRATKVEVKRDPLTAAFFG